MSNELISQVAEIIKTATFKDPVVDKIIKENHLEYVLAEHLVENGVTLNDVKTTIESGTGSADKGTKSKRAKLSNSEQKKLLYEIAEDTMPKIYEHDLSLSEVLDLMSRFTNYTALNLLLLTAQYPQATYLKLFDDWKEDGHSIKKGQKGIKLFKYEGQKVNKNGIEHSDYSIKTVFDVSQTDSEDVVVSPAFENKLLFSALVKDTKTPIKPVEQDKLPSGHSAYFDEKQNVILIAKDLPFCVQFNALCCEMMLSDICSRRKSYTRAHYEADCVCAAYVVSKRYGIDASYFDLNAVCEYAKEHSVDVRKTLERVRSNANSVINRIDTYIERSQGKEVVR